MWAVTDRWNAALKAPHTYATTVTVTVPGGSPVTVEFKSGSLSVDSTARIRRRVSGLRIVGDSATFDLISTPGALVKISHGINFGSSTELVPVISGEVSQPRQAFGDGTIDLTVLDKGQWLSRCRFLVPQVVTAGTTRVAAITTAVQAAIPGQTVTNLSSDTGTLISQQVWTEGPGDLVADLTRDGGTEAFFLPDGTFLIRDLPTASTLPVWYISAGDGGVLIKAERSRPMDRLYNTVVVRPSANDGSQTWAQQVAQVTDTTNPRHPNYIGVVPYFVASPTASTADVALGIAQRTLTRVLGTTDTLSLSSIANPALEANDSVRVTTAAINTEPAQTFQHFIDNYSLDLTTGAMSLATRVQVVTDA